jgi:Phosphotransferase enzyme family
VNKSTKPDPLELIHRVGIDPSGWHVEDLAHNHWLTPGVWRLERDDERVVVKWLSAERAPGLTPYEEHWTARSGVPERWNYWAREALVFQSGFATDFCTGGLSAPKCLGVKVTERDAVIVLAFEAGVTGENWLIPDYAAAAKALGLAQSSYLSGQGYPPQRAWLSRRFLSEYSTEKPVDWTLLDDDQAWNQPLIADCFPADLRPLATELHNRRDDLLQIMDRLPRTLCHLDFWTKNLIRRPDGTVVLLDWAFVGDGAIGEDIGNLIPDAAFDHFVPSSELPDLDAAVIEAYTSGLLAGGWDGDANLAQLSVWASSVKYDWLTPFMLASASAARQMKYGGSEEIDAKFRFKERGEALLFNARRAVLALDLASRLSI